MLVLVAALLWGTDSLFRFPTAETLDPTYIVFCEHVDTGILILLPWVAAQQPGQGLVQARLEGTGSPPMASWAWAAGRSPPCSFTASFRYVNPSVTILLQKLQPVFVVLLAFLFLGERPARKFYPWAVLALAAGFVLSFPDLDVSFLRERGNLHAKGVIYALAACAIWGVSTVAGRSLLTRTTPGSPPSGATSSACSRCVLILSAWCGRQVQASFGVMFGSRETMLALVYLSIVSGVIPMFIYYAGMARTPASVVTFIELLYPVSAVLLNTLFLHTPLTHIQLGAGSVLLFAVTHDLRLSELTRTRQSGRADLPQSADFRRFHRASRHGGCFCLP